MNISCQHLMTLVIKDLWLWTSLVHKPIIVCKLRIFRTYDPFVFDDVFLFLETLGVLHQEYAVCMATLIVHLDGCTRSFHVVVGEEVKYLLMSSFLVDVHYCLFWRTMLDVHGTSICWMVPLVKPRYKWSFFVCKFHLLFGTWIDKTFEVHMRNLKRICFTLLCLHDMLCFQEW